MKSHYADILALTDRPPTWWDEHGVPRYAEFHPTKCSDIYAKEAVLIGVRCQSCHAPFAVAITARAADKTIPAKQVMLCDQIAAKTLSYGDPPNRDCCPAGPTMSSSPQMVLAYWRCEHFAWWQHTKLTGTDITPTWDRDDSRPPWTDITEAMLNGTT
jgi:hypothetical protein